MFGYWQVIQKVEITYAEIFRYHVLLRSVDCRTLEKSFLIVGKQLKVWLRYGQRCRVKIVIKILFDHWFSLRDIII